MDELLYLLSNADVILFHQINRKHFICFFCSEFLTKRIWQVKLPFFINKYNVLNGSSPWKQSCPENRIMSMNRSETFSPIYFFFIEQLMIRGISIKDVQEHFGNKTTISFTVVSFWSLELDVLPKCHMKINYSNA